MVHWKFIRSREMFFYRKACHEISELLLQYGLLFTLSARSCGIHFVSITSKCRCCLSRFWLQWVRNWNPPSADKSNSKIDSKSVVLNADKPLAGSSKNKKHEGPQNNISIIKVQTRKRNQTNSLQAEKTNVNKKNKCQDIKKNQVEKTSVRVKKTRNYKKNVINNQKIVFVSFVVLCTAKI